MFLKNKKVKSSFLVKRYLTVLSALALCLVRIEELELFSITELTQTMYSIIYSASSFRAC